MSQNRDERPKGRSILDSPDSNDIATAGEEIFGDRYGASERLPVDDLQAWRAELRHSLHRELREMFHLQSRERGLTLDIFAGRLGIPERAARDLLDGKAELTIENVSDAMRAMGSRIDLKAMLRLKDMALLVSDLNYADKPVRVACDRKCTKAWGVNGRPKVQLSDDPDDISLLADHELGDAPANPGTYEGGHGKPMFPDRHNKWCVRECERSAMADPGQPLALPDFSVRMNNIYRSDPANVG